MQRQTHVEGPLEPLVPLLELVEDRSKSPLEVLEESLVVLLELSDLRRRGDLGRRRRSDRELLEDALPAGHRIGELVRRSLDPLNDFLEESFPLVLRAKKGLSCEIERREKGGALRAQDGS